LRRSAQPLHRITGQLVVQLSERLAGTAERGIVKDGSQPDDVPGPLKIPDPLLGGGQLAVEPAQLDVEVCLDCSSFKASNIARLTARAV